MVKISNQNLQKMARESFCSGARFFQLPNQNKNLLKPRFSEPKYTSSYFLRSDTTLSLLI
ncbi:hypothetical protein CS550_07200 [Porphyromonas gingivalis]|nr:hypothetical protein CS550_07200 [Porphyromonas gingivalis]